MMIENQIDKVIDKLKIKKKSKNIRVIDRQRSDESRYICIVKTTDGDSVVVKMYENSYNTVMQVNGWAKLAKSYKSENINVPRFLEFYDGNYGYVENMDNHNYLIWVEEYLEDRYSEAEKIERLSFDFFYDLGKCLGNMHTVSKNSEIKFEWNSPWVLFDKFCEEDLYDENYENVYMLYSELKNTSVDQKLLERIWQKYLSKREFVEIGYKHLPNGAVQGDLSINNIVLNQDYSLSGIVDFNIAGNEVFVNHMMQEGVFLSYLSDSFWNNEEEITNMTEKLSNFIKGYTTSYNMSNEEIDKVQTLYQIIRPFRRDKVYDTLNNISELDANELEERLKWIDCEMDKTINITCFDQ